LAIPVEAVANRFPSFRIDALSRLVLRHNPAPELEHSVCVFEFGETLGAYKLEGAFFPGRTFKTFKFRPIKFAE
jgi:hypothetical protein